MIIVMKWSLTLMFLFASVNMALFAGNYESGMTERMIEDEPLVQNFTVQGAVGKINATLQVPPLKAGEKCPLVILMHGILSNSRERIMTMTADKLQEAGIASIRFDFNGHGTSDGKLEDMTVPLEIEDARAIYEYARKLSFVSSISLLGHSQGGVVASLLGAQLGDNIKSMVLMAPAAVLEDDAKNGTTLGANFDPNNIPDDITVFNKRKIGKAYLESAQQLNIYKNAAAYKGPVGIVHGLADKIVPYSYGERYHQLYDGSEIFLLEDEDHSFKKNMELATDVAVKYLKSHVQ